MAGFLKDVFKTRTDNNRKGTVSEEWNHVLLLRDLEPLIADGAIERLSCPKPEEPDFRNRQCLRDLGTGEVYVYVAGWERGSPEFRNLANDDW